MAQPHDILSCVRTGAAVMSNGSRPTKRQGRPGSSRVSPSLVCSGVRHPLSTGPVEARIGKMAWEIHVDGPRDHLYNFST
jgi:hypothetical protein